MKSPLELNTKAVKKIKYDTSLLRLNETTMSVVVAANEEDVYSLNGHATSCTKTSKAQ